MPKGFHELNIWKKGYELLMEIYRITAAFPREEKFGLSAQMRNSANSVIANIAEAHGRYYFADKEYEGLSKGISTYIRSLKKN
jgi:four helix bundle protein